MAYDAVDVVNVARYSYLSFYLYSVIEAAEHISVLHLPQILLPLLSIDLDVLNKIIIIFIIITCYFSCSYYYLLTGAISLTGFLWFSRFSLVSFKFCSEWSCYPKFTRPSNQLALMLQEPPMKQVAPSRSHGLSGIILEQFLFFFFGSSFFIFSFLTRFFHFFLEIFSP